MQKLLYNTIHTKIGGENELVYTDGGPTYLPPERISVLHYHDRCEIGICKSGNGIWFMGNRSYAVSEGDIIVNPAGIAHYSRSIPTADNPQCRVKFYYFDEGSLLSYGGITSYITLTDGTVTSPVIITRSRHDELWFILDRMIRELDIDTDNDRFRLAAHWYAIFLLKLHGQPRESVREDIEIKPIFLPALRKIITEYSEHITVKELADACSLTPNYFNTAFRNCFGLTPMRYINRLRVGIAAELLCESNISITDIGSFVGFVNTSELYRHFTAVYSMSPSSYRTYCKMEK